MFAFPLLVFLVLEVREETNELFKIPPSRSTKGTLTRQSSYYPKTEMIMRLNIHLKLDDLYFHFIFKQVNPLYCLIQKALCFKSLENIQFRYLLTFITEYSMLNNHLLKDIALLILKKKKGFEYLN